jgi:hypothetical protein
MQPAETAVGPRAKSPGASSEHVEPVQASAAKRGVIIEREISWTTLEDNSTQLEPLVKPLGFAL